MQCFTQALLGCLHQQKLITMLLGERRCDKASAHKDLKVVKELQR